MKAGFEFLQTRALGQDLPIEDVARMEQLRFPPLLKRLYRSFVIDKDALQVDRFLAADGRILKLGSIAFVKPSFEERFNLVRFLGVREIEDDFEDAQFESEWEEEKLLRIGLLGQAGFGGLYVGCGDQNLDEIWKFNADHKTQYVKLCDDIFEFIRGLHFSYEFSNLDQSEYHKLRKEWDSDHWKLEQGQ